MDGYIHVGYDAAMHSPHTDPRTRQLPGTPDHDAASLTSGELARLQDEFTGFRIWRETNGERTRYVAQRLHPGHHPHTVVTDNPAELRAALSGRPSANPSTGS